MGNAASRLYFWTIHFNILTPMVAYAIMYARKEIFLMTTTTVTNFRKNVYSRLRSSLKKERDRQRKRGWKIDGNKEERKQEDFLIIKRKF